MNKEQLEHEIWHMKSEIEYNQHCKNLIKKSKLDSEQKKISSKIHDFCIAQLEMLIRVFQRYIKELKKEAIST